MTQRTIPAPADRYCIGCGADLSGHRRDAVFCGAPCKGEWRRRGAAFWGALDQLVRRRPAR